MQEEKEQTEVIERKRNFVARTVGVITGAVAAIVTGKILKDYSLIDFIRKGLASEVSDPAVIGVKNTIDKGYKFIKRHRGKLKPEELVEAVKKEGLLDIYKASKKMTAGMKKPIRIFNTIHDAAKKGIDEATAIINNPASKKLYDQAKEALAKEKDNILKAQINYRHAKEDVRAKAFYKVFAKEMQLEFRHSKHKPLIFAASAVSLCVIGYAAYRATKWLMSRNDAKKSQQQKLLAQRAASPEGVSVNPS